MLQLRITLYTSCICTYKALSDFKTTALQQLKLSSTLNAYNCYWLHGNPLKLYMKTFAYVCCIQIFKEKDSRHHSQKVTV